MKLSHAILVIALLCLGDASFANTSDLPELICQFDKPTMIEEKLKKAQECINNGNYSGAKNYLNGVLKLDPNNAKANELLAVCNNGGEPVASTRSNSSSSNSNTSNRGTSSSSTLSVSKSNLSFSSYGGTETITASGPSWSISVNPASWGHLSRSGNTLTLSVDANYTGNQRTDYFVLSAGGVEKRINITQSLVVICQNVIFYSNIPTNLEVKMKSISFKPDKITFTDSGTYLITNENEAYSYNM